MGNTKKKTSGKDLSIKIFLSLTAVLLVAVLLGSVLGSTGLLLRMSAPLSSANFKVDGAMMTYFYRTSYYTMVSQLGEYASYMGLDTSKPLKSQTYLDGTQTWHEFLLTSATDQAKQMLVLAEAAKAAGMELDAEDEETLQANMDALAQSAAAYNYPSVNSFVAAQYGEGLKENDIRNAIELSLLASKYSAKMSEEITITDDEVNTYFAEHEDTYTFVDLRQYTFDAGEALEVEGVTDEQKNQMKADLQKKANELAACKTAAEFDAYLIQYMKDNTAAAGEITEDNIQSNLDSTKYEGYNARTTKQGEWAFAEGRKAGDTTVIEAEDSVAFTVVLLERTKYREETLTRNVRHILFQSANHTDAAGAKAAAEEVLAKWEASGKTENDFAALATEYTEDTGSQANGGLYENVMTGQMVPEFENWLFDATRKAGDVEIVESADYGAHIMYYVGEGEPQWEVNVRSAITNEKYNTAYEALEAATEIKENAGALKMVD